MLQGLVTAGVAAGTVPLAASSAAAKPTDASVDWQAFDRVVGSAFDRMRLVGAAVAVVSANRVLHTVTFGSRCLQPRRPVTRHTRFRVGSTTKSMTAALVATYVDEGALAWDQPVIDAWSEFRAPTEELTRGLRVRDLLAMASGLGEPPGADLHLGVPTAAEIVEGVARPPGHQPDGCRVLLQQHGQRRGGLPTPARVGGGPGRPGAGIRASHARPGLPPC